MADPFTIGTALSVGSSLLGGRSAKKAAKTQSRLAKNQMAIAGTAYSPINVQGIGGAGVTFGGSSGGYGSLQPGQTLNTGSKSTSITDLGGGFRRVGRYGVQSDIGNVQINAGDLGQFRPGVLGGMLGGIQQYGQPGGLNDFQNLGSQAALGGLGQQLQSLQGLGSLENQAQLGSQLGFGGLAQAYGGPQFGADVQQAAMQGALGQTQAAGQGFDQAYQNSLGLLRESARPGEELAGANFLQRMFDTGGRATSGGAMQTQQFAQGLAQADTNRQLQALGEARAQQTQALQQAQGLTGIGQGIQGAQQQALQGAVSRFGGLQSLASNLSNQRFNRGAGLAQTGGGLFELGQQQQLAPLQQQAAGLGLAQGGLNFLGGIQDQAYRPFEAAQNLMAQQANARMGQSSIGGANALSAPAAQNASLWGSIGGALGGISGSDISGAFGKLGGLFGGGQQASPQPQYYGGYGGF